MKIELDHSESAFLQALLWFRYLDVKAELEKSEETGEPARVTEVYKNCLQSLMVKIQKQSFEDAMQEERTSHPQLTPRGDTPEPQPFEKQDKRKRIENKFDYTKECMFFMKKQLEGSEIQCKLKFTPDAKWVDTEEPAWNFMHYDYQMKPKEPGDGIPATVQELMEIDIKWYKTKDTGIIFCTAHESSCLSYSEDASPDEYFRFNPNTQCWEADWSNE